MAGVLAAEGAIDPADRRNRLIRRQAIKWRQSPPDDPVIAAGLTGGIPALTELIRVVASLENGAVILPGLDRDRDPAEWAAIEQDEAHPQYLLASLLEGARSRRRRMSGTGPRVPRSRPLARPLARAQRVAADR